jgi:CRP/FNR family transcriptional regulator, cyclic AMP receptor protein
VSVPRVDPRADDRIQRALAASHLRGLPAGIIEDLLVGARRHKAFAGDTLRRVGEGERHVELVVNGVVRVHVGAPDGRTLTVRYCRTGALIGVLSLYAEPFVMPVTTQAVADSELVEIRPAVVRRLADRDIRVARALLLELSERAAAFASEIGGSAFSSIRQRIARHLLDLATHRQRGSELIAQVSQQELADAVGTVREVVVRTLREFRQDGILETRRGEIRIVTPDRLLAEAYPQPGNWNTGP